MRIAADAAHLVAADAVRRTALIVARGAALDVPSRGVAVERARAGQAPAGRMRIDRARPGGDALVLVAGLAGADRMATRAGRGVGALVDHVPPEEILPVDEPAIRPIDQLRLDRHHGGLRMAVEAEVLIVAGRARLLRGARDARVPAEEVALVGDLRRRRQGIRSEIDVAGGALRIRVLLGVLVTFQAGRVPVADGRRLPWLGEPRVALRAVLLHPLDVSGVVQIQARFALRPGGGVLDVEMAEVALPVGLLLLVALQALRFLRQEVAGGQGLRVIDGLVAGDAVDVGLLVAGVGKQDLVAGRTGAQDGGR